MKTIIAAFVLIVSGIASGAHAQEMIDLDDITTAIVPTSANPRADRDFDGNGPTMVVGVRLFVARGGRAIFANVMFSARENGGDGTRTFIGPVPFLVWRWNPAEDIRRVQSINSPTISTIRRVSGPGCVFGCALIGPAEDGGLIVTVPAPAGGPVRDVTLLGDTAGDDISTDNDPHGDTSIRRIRFNPIEVTFTNRLGG